MKRTAFLCFAMLLLAVLIVCAVFPIAADGELQSGTWKNLTWTFDETTGELRISGEGAMAAFEGQTEGEPPLAWHAYKDSVRSVTIEEGVTSIGKSAFYAFRELTSATIADSVTSIDDCAFESCLSMTGVAFSENTMLKNIGKFAFRYCEKLTDFAIPAAVETLGESAFYGCSSLESIVIPEGVTQLNGTFHGCSGLESIVIPEAVTDITGAFSECIGLTEVEFAENTQLTSIGERAFYHCENLKGIWIPEGITIIKRSAFQECKGLTVIDFGENSQLTRIEWEAFAGCSGWILRVSIPAGVTVIENGAFRGCGMKYLGFASTELYIGESAFQNCRFLSSVSFPTAGALTEISPYTFKWCDQLAYLQLPEGLVSIGTGAFYECKNIQDIDFPKSLETIGASAFEGCKLLHSLYFKEDGALKSIGGDAFRGCWSIKELSIPEGVTSIGQSAFRGCSTLKSVTLPSTAKALGMYAFAECSELEDFVLPDGKQSIADSLLYGCTHLKRVVIPSTVTRIDAAAFGMCDDLEEIVFGGTTCQWNQIKKGDGWDDTGDDREIRLITTADHAWDQGTVTAPPTHLADGVKTFTCAECEETKTETVAKLTDHTYGDWEPDRDDRHKHTCACGETEYADHVYDNDKDASCNECGHVREMATELETTGGSNQTGDPNKAQSGCGAAVSSGLLALLSLMGALACLIRKADGEEGI